MLIERTALTGVYLLTPHRFGDHRGFFCETYNRQVYASKGIDCEFVQDNHSLSTQAGTVRGLHFQGPPHAQAKLVRCGRGAIFDVVVDIRRGSPTYGKWIGYELSADNGQLLFVPAGFAHGFMALQRDSEIVYKCSEFYAPETEGALLWNDPALAIDWPVFGEIVVSGKDAKAPLFADLDSPFTWEGVA